MESLKFFGHPLSQLFSPENLAALVRAGLVLVLGLVLVYLLSKWTRRYLSLQFTPQRGFVVSKIIQYVGVSLIIVLTLSELGFQLGPLLGAAGIVGIALGFASQTSVSNVISGIFLIAEQPFVVDDVIQVGNITGQVLSIDMLSVKLRTFDNQFVRIPNETILKSEVINLTHFPIRRIDIPVSVAYKEDLARVKELLHQIAFENPLCLQEPEPMIRFEGFGSSSIELVLAVWTTTPNRLTLKNQLCEEIKKRFEEAGIEIPFPHLSIYTGAVTQPFPLTLVPTPSTTVGADMPSKSVSTGEETS
ncbi:MAG: mechanosensitive ion channel family protein [Calditrichaeota bacterium]|nr:MAG: mechanosensitive ion channel family protein [Calditrichota bacterium]